MADIGIQQITDIIIASTTSYLVSFSPVFVLMAGLILAVGVVYMLIGFLRGEKMNSDSDNL